VRHREVNGLTHFPDGKATVRELTIGEMRRIRRDTTDDEERGLRMLVLALVDPPMTLGDIDALPASAIPELAKLTETVGELQRPEETTADPPA
jgi:hypothetical protein